MEEASESVVVRKSTKDLHASYCAVLLEELADYIWGGGGSIRDCVLFHLAVVLLPP